MKTENSHVSECADPSPAVLGSQSVTGILDEAGMQSLENEVKQRIDQAVAEADTFPQPEPLECLEDVYA